MARRIKMERRRVRSAVLTLRMSEEEMLKFKLAALSLGKKRARIVRDRLGDLIGGTVSPAGSGDSDTVITAGHDSVSKAVPPAVEYVGTANELGK